MISPFQLSTLTTWTFSSEELHKTMGVGQKGLSEKEVRDRLNIFGLNDIERTNRRTALIIFLSQYKNPLVLILIGASLISFFTGDHLDATIILIMIGINSLLGFIQEYRSEKAAELLRHKASLKAMVLRNGEEIKIPATFLVPGDLVRISQGSVVPADLRLISSEELLIDESLITGESFPVEKSVDPLPSNITLPQEQKNLAFSRTSVLTGEAVGIVIATGSQTILGKSSREIEGVEAETEFQTGIRHFGNFLVVLIIILVILIFLINVFLKPLLFSITPNYLEALLFSLALAIGITPELLPFIITINLSRGAMQMSKKHVIVKKLIAIEDIGNADVLCTDKTGTITEGKIFLENYLNFDGRPDPNLLIYGLLSNAKDQGNAHPLDKALADYPGIKGVAKTVATYKKIAELPFDFNRKRMSALVKNSSGYFVVSKGATEPVLSNCTSVLVGNKTKLLLAPDRKILHEKYVQLSSQGYRLLAIAVKKTGPKKMLTGADEKSLTFYGFLAFSDRPKNTVQETIQQLESLSIQIKILTGDNEYVAKHVCQEVGLDLKGIILGETLDKLTDQELSKVVNQTTLFAKITPHHKLRIIQAVKTAGHTVAFLGDGANDAPALKAADVGISVDSSLDVAKEAADIILLRKSLEVLVEGVKDGRKTFANTMKYIYTTSSSNFGNMFSLTGGSLLLPFLPMLPSQVILANFLGDLPFLAVSTDNVDEAYLRKPKHWDIRSIGVFMIPFGLIVSLFDFITFFLMIKLTGQLADSINLFRSAWFVESLGTTLLLILLVRTRKFFWQSQPSLVLVLLVFGSIFSSFLLVYLPIGSVVRFVPLPMYISGIIVLLLVIYVTMIEIVKRIYNHYVSV